MTMSPSLSKKTDPQLAMFGGEPAVPSTLTGGTWPVVSSAEEAAVLRVLRSGKLTATAEGETEVAALEQEWAQVCGVDHCTAVSSGTAALQVALRALDIGPGDEVVLPALTMNATAQAVLQVGATPVFADIDPDTFTLDPAAAAATCSSSTAALLPVHLHGLPADMDMLNSLARRIGVPVVEDAAQAHGALYAGQPTGSLGAAGCFSLHPSKNLPTCGEGGLITTTSPSVHAATLALRNFGERPPTRARSYIAHRSAGNARLGPVQASFTRAQLHRFRDDLRRRDCEIRTFLGRLENLPGLRVPHVPLDRTHAWHILRFMLVPDEMGLADLPPAAIRAALHRILRAERVPVSQYQTAPLQAHPAFRMDVSLNDVAAAAPVACATIDGSLCLQRRHLAPGAAPLLSAYADGFEKVWQHLELVRRIAGSSPAVSSWRETLEAE